LKARCREPLTRAWAAATAIAVVGLTLRSWGSLNTGDALGILMALIPGCALASYVVAAKGELDRGAHAVELARPRRCCSPIRSPRPEPDPAPVM